MRQPIVWNQRQEEDWLAYTVQPPLGVTQGEYYITRREFGGNAELRGHTGSLEAVVHDGEIVFVEFNELTMPAYYNQYFAGRDKRRSDYGIWQASKPRQAKAGVVLVDGMRHVELQILRRQSFRGEFELLAGASGSMRNMLPMTEDLAAAMERPSPLRYYGVAKAFGYGLTGWLRVIEEGGRIISCKYDEIFADHQQDIRYPELKQYYRQSKYHSPCYEDPYPPGWDRHAWNINFATLMDMLNTRVTDTQNLRALEGLPYVEGENLGELWDREGPADGPVTNNAAVRYPAWDNYLHLTDELLAVLPGKLGRGV